MTLANCSNCKYFKAPEVIGQPGLCRRLPPHPVVINGQLNAAYPMITRDNWCGEHQVKVVLQ